MTDTAKPMTRAEAEKAARAGAKVRHNDWPDGEWVTFSACVLIDEKYRALEFEIDQYGGPDGWSIVTPAPDTAKAETDDSLTPRNQTERLAVRQVLQAVRNNGFSIYAEWPDTTRKPIPLDDVPGKYTPGPRQAVAYMPNGEQIEPTTPWRPTIGRDAVTRDGRRAVGLSASELIGWPLVATIGSSTHTFREDGRHHWSEHHPLDLIGDWVEPEQAETPKRKWTDWGDGWEGTGRLMSYLQEDGDEIRVKRIGDTFSIKRRNRNDPA